MRVHFWELREGDLFEYRHDRWVVLAVRPSSLIIYNVDRGKSVAHGRRVGSRVRLLG